MFLGIDFVIGLGHSGSRAWMQGSFGDLVKLMSLEQRIVVKTPVLVQCKYREIISVLVEAGHPFTAYMARDRSTHDQSLCTVLQGLSSTLHHHSLPHSSAAVSSSNDRSLLDVHPDTVTIYGSF